VSPRSSTATVSGGSSSTGSAMRATGRPDAGGRDRTVGEKGTAGAGITGDVIAKAPRAGRDEYRPLVPRSMVTVSIRLITVRRMSFDRVSGALSHVRGGTSTPSHI
jgi:hypothetical protein